MTIPILIVFLFAVYATNLVGGKRLFLRSSEPISSLQIMAEENRETKIPQGQNGHGSAAIPPSKLLLLSSVIWSKSIPSGPDCLILKILKMPN
ncbi:hypothetical protein C3L33_20326, partial [Rhododendron williamsianum]